MRAWLPEALETWSTAANAASALAALESTGRRLTLTGTHADLMASAIAQLRAAAEAAQRAPAKERARATKARPPATSSTRPTKSKRRTEAPTEAPTEEPARHASFRLTRTRKTPLSSGARRALSVIGTLTVGLFAMAVYLSDRSIYSTTPARDIQAELRARCGDLKPLRCRLKAECDRAQAAGCYELGLVQEVGNGGPIDVPQAAKNYERACELRSADACQALADLHRNGRGVPLDLLRATALYEEACRLGAACTGAVP